MFPLQPTRMQPDRKTPHLALNSPTGKSYLSLRFSRRFTLRAVVLVLVSGAAYLGVVRAFEKIRTALQSPLGSTTQLAPGPWGDITATSVLLEPPASLLSVQERLGSGYWVFRADTPDQVGQFLHDAGLTGDQALLVTQRLQPVTGEAGLLAAKPPDELVRELTIEVRSKLYNRLAAIPQNYAQAGPWRVTHKHLNTWLGSGTLPQEVVDDVKGLLWQRGEGFYFSDYNLVSDSIDSPLVRIELLRLLSRQTSLILHLQVPPGGHVEDLVSYYGVRGRREEVNALLRGISEAGGGNIDISDLLPFFARARLYRFTPPRTGNINGPQCYWASLNFFSGEEPNVDLDELKTINKALAEDFEGVKGDPQFGDLVLLQQPDNSTIHACVYIADDVVFTKNGRSLAAPFIFSTIGDLLAFHGNSESIHLAYYRQKGS